MLLKHDEALQPTEAQKHICGNPISTAAVADLRRNLHDLPYSNMGLTLFQPALNASALNASAVPVGVFPAPVSPDLYSCRGYYSYPSPPTAADCRIALSQIPQSTEPVPWYDLPGPGREHVLPISVQHGP